MPWSGIIYQPSTPPFKVAFTPINGEEGAWVFVPLSCASNWGLVVQTGFVNSASKRESEATERGPIR